MKKSFVKIVEKFATCSEKSSRMSVAELTTILISKSDPKTFLQPILKDILTVWLLTMFDPVGEISSLQRRALETVFPSSGTKFKLLIEKSDNHIWKELMEYVDSNEKFQRLKEVTLTEMEGTSEDAEGVIELVKTEIIGVISLLLGNGHLEGEIRRLLFLTDKEIGSSRRAALYRFVLKYQQSGWLMETCKTLLLKETNPTALVAAIDLFEKGTCESLPRVIQNEKLLLNVICYAPVSEFKRFGQLLNPIDNFIIKLCTGNLMNKDRFMSFWRDVAVNCIEKSENRIGLLESLLFPHSAINVNLFAFLPLTVEESMKCIIEAFKAEEIVQICKTKPCPQSVYALSLLPTSSIALRELETLVQSMKVSDLQGKDLMKVIPESVLFGKLRDRIDELGTCDIIRLIQIVSNERAVELLKDRQEEFWKLFMTRSTTLLTPILVKNVLFQIEGFRRHARIEQVNNVMLITCAFESTVEVFDSWDHLETEILTEGFGNVQSVQVQSPLLKLSLKYHMFLDDPKIKSLSEIQLKKLFEFIEIEKDVELFDYFNCQYEEFYPIYFIESLNDSFSQLPSDPIEILLYNPNKQKEFPVELLKKLASFPLKRFSNQRKVLKCAFLFNLMNLINFTISVNDFETISDEDNFELFCLSKVIMRDNSNNNICSNITSFKSTLKFYSHLSSLTDSSKINGILDEIIFCDTIQKETKYFIALTCSISPILAVRSDNLSGLISCLCECNLEEREKVTNDNIDNLEAKKDEISLLLLLLLVSSHFTGRNEEDLKREFWRVQFNEKLKEKLKFNESDSGLLNELKFRIAAGIWNKLADPEVELLDDCNFKAALTNTLLSSSSSGSFEEFGKGRLILMSAPFLKESFSFKKLLEFYDSVDSIHPSMDLAYRSVYLQLHMDEQLVGASLLQICADGDEQAAQKVFPFYEKLLEAKSEQRFAILLEMFVSAAEGSRDDWKLLGIFAEALKTGIIPLLRDYGGKIDGTLESFDFTPRDFVASDLIKHVLHRLCAIFPLIIYQGGLPRDIFTRSQMIIQQREIERIKRQPKISFESSLEITLKPILTSTTKLVNLRVRFVDEITLSIDLHLPAFFPLEPVRVEGRDKSGLAESKWKAALLSLQTLLRCPTFSGNLVEIIKRWQANALKLFQGLEECAVCYCVLHPSDKSLPGPACKQCKHKFHATCLYKWFKSSGNATCPLCRALF